ncbi:hypothetical protein GJW-30_1_00365 [Variibacter gotjawalensis]|uniref:Leucine-binding protein domain-containing protein n=1 Tax=Variibacter gotjawalensis TaxID=1333996 RepID=A0A0S3PPL7_9BRAD|nr:ABC-type branched-subunit amino acid transport system substrate-binding protein [Variibacter gotjawalensis]BAT57855.1 hypothetical protein GJW-30_1_00365 [Variibacter gotjawalensis]
MGWQPTYQSEARIYAAYILKNFPNAKVGILYQNDDFGKDYLKGLKDGFGDKAEALVVSEQPYEVTEATVDSQVITLKASGADVFVNISTPKFSAQAIKKAHEIGWKPAQFLNNISVSIGSVLKPAGFEASQDIISAGYLKEATDPAWKDDPSMKDWAAFMDKYYPDGDKLNVFTVYGYSVAQTLVQTLKQAGDDLTRANVMKEAANLKDLVLPLALPGIKANTSPTDYYVYEQMQLMKFKGETWERFGDIIEGKVGGS